MSMNVFRSPRLLFRHLQISGMVLAVFLTVGCGDITQQRLYDALMEGDRAKVESLIESGYISKAQQVKIAIVYGDYEAFDSLVEGGVELTSFQRLAIAINAGDYQRVESLIDSGVNVNSLIDYEEVSPFPYKFLTTPLIMAVEGAINLAVEGTFDPQIVRLLIEKGAEVNGKDSLGNTPLLECQHLELHSENLEIIELLIENGADLDVVGHHGETILHKVINNGNLKTAELLLNSGANIEATSSQGNTPLWTAAWHGNVDAVRLLISLDANIHAIGHTGLSISDQNNAIIEDPAHSNEPEWHEIGELLAEKITEENLFTPFTTGTIITNVNVSNLSRYLVSNITIDSPQGEEHRRALKAILLNKDAQIRDAIIEIMIGFDFKTLDELEESTQMAKEAIKSKIQSLINTDIDFHVFITDWVIQ